MKRLGRIDFLLLCHFDARHGNVILRTTAAIFFCLLCVASTNSFAADPPTDKFLVQKEISARYSTVIWGVEFGETELNEIRKDELVGLKKYMAGVPWLNGMTKDEFEQSDFHNKILANVNTPQFISQPDVEIGIAAYQVRQNSAGPSGILGALLRGKTAGLAAKPTYQPWVAVKDQEARATPPAAMGELRAERDFIGEYERLTIVKQSNERVALKFRTGYLTAYEGGGSAVLARRGWVLEWEEWTIEKHDDGSISFVSPKGVPLRVHESPPYTLVNHPPPAGANPAWSRFRLIDVQDNIFALKSARGTYVSAHPEARR